MTSPSIAAEPETAPPTLGTLDQKFSYTLGINLGKQLKQNDVNLDFDLYMKGLKDALEGKPLLLTEDQTRQVMTDFQKELRDRQMDKGKKEGEAYLAANKLKEGVLTTASGLQYKIITKGKGKVPTTNDTVITHYRGTLIDGTEFDNSYKRSEPATFPVTGVIKGWTEALTMMPVGSKWQLVISSELAYGERGRPSIPPNSTLLFDIELIGISDKATEGK